MATTMGFSKVNEDVTDSGLDVQGFGLTHKNNHQRGGFWALFIVQNKIYLLALSMSSYSSHYSYFL